MFCHTLYTLQETENRSYVSIFRHNASANPSAEAQAPWDTVIKEMIHIMLEMAKALNAATAAKDEKKEEKNVG
jgi:hypothetical protein